MKARSTTAGFIGFLAILACLIAASWAFLVWKSMGLKGEVAAVTLEARESSSKESYLASVRNALREAKSDLDAIESRFIDRESVPAFIDLLERKALEAGVDADFGSIDLDQAGQAKDTLRIRMSGFGTWDGIIHLISILDSMPYSLRVDSIRVSRSQATEEKALALPWNFNLDIIQHLAEKI
jgi:hypothetical protein